MKMPNWPKPFLQGDIILGLERIKALLYILGNPHHDIPPVIHITGTNGKGSTLSFIKSILEHAGYKTHSYTSPHLIEFNERIKINGIKISDAELNQLSSICRLAEEKLGFKVTFFEGVTAIAFLAFKNTKADFTLLEVGMGGRLDATNVAVNTIASVITPIAYDHTDMLGESLSQIAFEKCGILRPDIPAIISMQTDEASGVINQYAKNINSQIIEYEYEWGCELNENNFHFYSNQIKTTYPIPSLIGDHQIINASCAIATVKFLNLNIDNQTIAKALTNTYWPARLECLKKGRLVDEISGDWQVWIDGAHNDSGAQTIAYWAIQNSNMPLYIVCGMTRGRKSDNFLGYFKNIANYVVGVRVTNESMSYSGEYVRNAALKLGFKSIATDDVIDAIKYITDRFPQGKILICGSLYLAGEVIMYNTY